MTFCLLMNYGITHTLEGRKENLPSLAVLTGGVQVLFSRNRVTGRVKDVRRLRRPTQNKHHSNHLSTGAPVATTLRTQNSLSWRWRSSLSTGDTESELCNEFEDSLAIY